MNFDQLFCFPQEKNCIPQFPHKFRNIKDTRVYSHQQRASQKNSILPFIKWKAPIQNEKVTIRPLHSAPFRATSTPNEILARYIFNQFLRFHPTLCATLRCRVMLKKTTCMRLYELCQDIKKNLLVKMLYSFDTTLESSFEQRRSLSVPSLYCFLWIAPKASEVHKLEWERHNPPQTSLSSGPSCSHLTAQVESSNRT